MNISKFTVKHFEILEIGKLFAFLFAKPESNTFSDGACLDTLLDTPKKLKKCVKKCMKSAFFS